MLGATWLLVHRPLATTLARYDGCLPVNYLTTLPLGGGSYVDSGDGYSVNKCLGQFSVSPNQRFSDEAYVFLVRNVVN